MMVNFDFLSEPLQLTDGIISVLYIENPKLFRSVFNAFITCEVEEEKIVFSERFIPMNFNNSICVIGDFFRLSYSNATMKKMYEQLEKYCNYELPKETLEIKTHIVNYIEYLMSSFDYDFEFNYDISLTDIFKTINLKPNIYKNDILNALLDYILIVNKYVPQKCFVLLNLHLYFEKEELDLFYKDIINNHIKLLLIEGKKVFETSSCENVVVYDNDFCEIIEN